MLGANKLEGIVKCIYLKNEMSIHKTSTHVIIDSFKKCVCLPYSAKNKKCAPHRGD